MFELAGWIGGFLLATCAVPQAIKVYKEKTAEGLSWGMLLFWFFGEIFTIAYIIQTNIETNSFQMPLIFNYLLNIIIVGYIIGAKIFYKKYNLVSHKPTIIENSSNEKE